MAFQTPLFALALYLVVVQQCAWASVDLDYLSFTHHESGVTCKIDKSIDRYTNRPTDSHTSSRTTGVNYYNSKRKTVAVEFNDNQIHCCYLEVFDPLTITWRSDGRCTNILDHQYLLISNKKRVRANRNKYLRAYKNRHVLAYKGKSVDVYFNNNGGLAICNPDGTHHCCSRKGWCAGSSLHCENRGVDYALPAFRPVQKSRNYYTNDDDKRVREQMHPCTAPARNKAIHKKNVEETTKRIWETEEISE